MAIFEEAESSCQFCKLSAGLSWLEGCLTLMMIWYSREMKDIKALCFIRIVMNF